ncbi:MAG TPA: winged helix-turn-helix domain-containing protein [Methylomirabilota bacterium]|nr:winged helix-turn-helix domain-containing protein [Methylomirabilota bacterium]
MVVKSTSSPFGSQTRTRVLLALFLLGESYPRELARVLDIPLFGVQKALGSLELDGIVAGRAVGRTRVFQLEPRYFARDPLQQFLLRLSEPEVELRRRLAALRRRPRRGGKPL